MTQDSLHFLPVERWSELQDLFKKDWPRGISAYGVLETQRQWQEQGIDYGFKVYCPFGDVQNGMVAFNVKKDFYEVIIQCPNDNTDNLGDAMRKTKLIDWGRRIIVPYAPSHVIDCIKTAVPDIDIKLLPSDTFILEKPQDDVILPENTTFGALSSEHVETVDAVWPHRYPTSLWYFDLLIKLKCGYGFFVNNALVSWVFVNEVGMLLHMYTIEGHRRKGYGELLLKLVSNALLKESRLVFGYCVKGNTGGCKLFNNAGFTNSHKIAWCYLNDELK